MYVLYDFWVVVGFQLFKDLSLILNYDSFVIHLWFQSQTFIYNFNLIISILFKKNFKNNFLNKYKKNLYKNVKKICGV